MRPLMLFIVALCWMPVVAEAKLRVLATVPDLAAIARAVGDDDIHVSALALPSQDPHFVDARPHLVLELHRADLLLMIGIDLESGWLPTLITGSRNPRLQQGSEHVLDCSTVAELKQIPQVRIDRTMGDVHPGGNPHYLTDPANARRVAVAVASRLGALDPKNKAAYQARAQTFVAQLTKALTRWQARLAPYRGTPVVGFHRSWIYFTDRFGLNIVGEVEPKPGIAPNAAHVVRVIKLMRSKQVPLILQEAYYPDKAAQLIADKAGAVLLKVEGGTRFHEGKTYIDRINTLVSAVADVLNKKEGA